MSLHRSTGMHVMVLERHTSDHRSTSLKVTRRNSELARDDTGITRNDYKMAHRDSEISI